jgi:hypothetical protein
MEMQRTHCYATRLLRYYGNVIIPHYPIVAQQEAEVMLPRKPNMWQYSLVAWYFSSWASGEPHHSGFKSQLVALLLWCVMFLVWQFFVGNPLSVVLVLFPDIFFKLLITIPVASVIPGMTNHFIFYILWITILKYLYLIYFQLHFVLNILIIIIIIIFQFSAMRRVYKI